MDGHLQSYARDDGVSKPCEPDVVKLSDLIHQKIGAQLAKLSMLLGSSHDSFSYSQSSRNDRIPDSPQGASPLRPVDDPPTRERRLRCAQCSVMNALPDFPTDQGQRDLVQWAEQVLRSDEEHFLIPYQLETSLSKLFVSLVFVGQITFPHIVSTAVDEMTDNPLSPYGQADLSYFLNLPFSIIGGVASAIGSIGAISLWWRRRHGRMWLVTNLFLPGLERSLYALLYAFIRAYFTGTGNFSVHDQITMIILAVSVLFCASAAFVYYNVNKKRRRAQ